MAKRKASKITPPAPKRNKTRFVLYETLADHQIAIEDVAQGMARAVAYEDDALQQIMALLAKSAGLKGTPEIDVTSPKHTASSIEKLCEGVSAAYPLVNGKFAQRFGQLVSHFYPTLYESQSDDSLTDIIPFIAALSTVHLRSLRRAAVAFCSPLAASIRQILEAPQTSRQQRKNRSTNQLAEETLQSINDILTKRALDVSADIRELAVKALPFFPPGLDDEDARVRCAALESVGDAELTRAQQKRINEIAHKDVDVRCRVAAVKLMENPEEFLADNEFQVCAVAADTYLQNHTIEDAKNISRAGSVALARASKLSISDAVNFAMRTESVDLLRGACVASRDNGTLVASLLTSMGQLLNKFTHSDDLLAQTMSLFEFVDLQVVLERDLESDVYLLLQDVCAVYLEHPSTTIIDAFSNIARPLVDNESFAAQSRIRLSEVLEQLILSPADILTRAKQVAGLGRYIDISDFASQDVWSIQDPVIKTFARNAAFHGDAVIMRDAIKYLSEYAPIATDEILQVLVISRVRNVAVPYETESLNLRQAAKSTIAAARAAEVIAN